ncbi:MAG TPA: hypothetical protein VF838_13605 [Trebonia sp.]
MGPTGIGVSARAASPHQLRLGSTVAVIAPSRRAAKLNVLQAVTTE